MFLVYQWVIFDSLTLGLYNLHDYSDMEGVEAGTHV